MMIVDDWITVYEITLYQHRSFRISRHTMARFMVALQWSVILHFAKSLLTMKVKQVFYTTSVKEEAREIMINLHFEVFPQRS